MTDSSDNSMFPATPREGAFDAQLSFPLPYVEAPSPIARIVKRDGREVAFDIQKIADAIFKAAKSIGGDDRDRAESLASGVTIYLAKKLNGDTPSVDHVHDAVEKVLIEMGHARTALAYARYRDKRARLRKLRTGDVRAILGELDEARRTGELLEGAVQRPLFVRTSDERLAGWDRERIVEALVRETRMPESDAQTVALDVEGQIMRAGLTTLTAALVREMVDATLVARGLEIFRSRHMRLGVPLYDTERILCTPNQGELEGLQDPASTDVALAQRVKREFALSQVHSPDVTDAHLRGDLHLHDLAQIDRLHSASHSLEFLRRFGLAMYTGSRFAPPAIHADALIAQASRFTVAMQRHFARTVRWLAVNEALALLLDEAASRDLDRLAHLALFGFSTPSVAADTRTVELGLEWQDASKSARRFAERLVDVWGTVLDSGGAHGVPCLCADVSSESITDAAFRDWLSRLLATPQRRAQTRVKFVRGLAARPRVAWQAQDTRIGEVTLNLPRLAGNHAGEQAFFAALSHGVSVAVNALAEKKAFIERLLAFGGVGPMSALTFRHGGSDYLDMDNAAGLISVTGMNECAQLVTGETLLASPAAVAFAQRVLEYIAEAARATAIAAGINILVGAEADGACAQRFALLDLQNHAATLRYVIKSDPITRDATYTPGVRCPGALTPMERLRKEGALHAHLTAGAATTIALGDADLTPASILSLIEKALLQTDVDSLLFA